MSVQRNNMGAELMEALQMLKFSIVKGCGLDFTSVIICAEELRVMEECATDRASIPEDMIAFIRSLHVFEKF